MRSLIYLALFLTTALPGFGQAAASAGPGLPSDPRAVFAAAEPFYDFTDAKLKPWYLKATYQLYDEKGKPTKQGTYEYWWASPQVYRSSWTRAGATHTDWHTADGKFYRTESGEPLKYFERNLESMLLRPLPAEVVLASDRTRLEMKTVSARSSSGSVKLPCVVMSFSSQAGNGHPAPNPAAEDRFCFEPPNNALVLASSDFISTVYSHVVTMQGRYVARQFETFIGKYKAFSMTVDQVDGISATEAALTPAADATPDSLVVGPLQVAPADAPGGPGSLPKKFPPLYPPDAKAERIQGLVLLGVTIGKDGKVKDVDVLESPADSLSRSAVECVKQWEYKPYLLDGAPVEVETVIRVFYTMGG